MTDAPETATLSRGDEPGEPATEAVTGVRTGGSGPTGPATGPSGRRRMTLLLAVAAFVYAADLASKVLVVAKLADHEPIALLGGLLTLRLVRNPGAAFGIGVGMTVIFTTVAALVILVILRVARQLHSVPWAVALGMLLGGALGNLTDRVFRSPGVFVGHVVDFLELPRWPVFNLADSAIVLSSVTMVVLSFRGLRLDGTRERPDDRADGDGAGRDEAAGDTEPRR